MRNLALLLTLVLTTSSTLLYGIPSVSAMTRDYCPDGDNTGSFYDSSCDVHNEKEWKENISDGELSADTLRILKNYKRHQNDLLLDTDYSMKVDEDLIEMGHRLCEIILEKEPVVEIVVNEPIPMGHSLCLPMPTTLQPEPVVEIHVEEIEWSAEIIKRIRNSIPLTLPNTANKALVLPLTLPETWAQA